jgi:hypothetical protein
MNTEEGVKATIISGLCRGRTVSEIVAFNNASKSIVKRLKKRYDDFITGGGLPEDFSSERKDHRRRSDALDDDTVATLQQLVDRYPGRSMRSLAREFGIS